MSRIQACLALAVLSAVPGAALAQVEVSADTVGPKPAEISAIGEPVVADGLVPKPAGAGQETDDIASSKVLGLEDVRLVYSPPPSRYQPEGTAELADRGRSVEIACVVGPDGRMQGCSAAADRFTDPKVAELALTDVSQFIVAPTTRGGAQATGQTLRIICRFEQAEESPGGALAALDSDSRP